MASDSSMHNEAGRGMADFVRAGICLESGLDIGPIAEQWAGMGEQGSATSSTRGASERLNKDCLRISSPARVFQSSDSSRSVACTESRSMR
jgi:hypothetical protein